MKILITGGTGFIGRNLVDNLSRQGHRIRLLVRKSPFPVFSSEIELFQGDLTKFSTIEKAFENIEIVYHLAGKLGEANVPRKIYEDIHCTGTENVVKATLRFNRIKKFIHLSSCGILGPIPNPPADETRPYAPSNIYEKTKAIAEQIVLEAFKNSNLPAIIIRPEFVYGPGDLHVLGLFKAIQRKFFVILGEGKYFLHPTYIDDLIDGLILALHTDLTGEIFSIAGPRPVTVEELANSIATQLKVFKPVHIPLWLGYSLAVFFESIGKIAYFNPPFNMARYKYFTENRAFSIAKAEKLLNYKPRYDLKAGLKKTIDWYKKNNYL